MKIVSLKSAALALLPAALLTLGACSTTIPGEQNTTVKKSPAGTTVVDNFKATAIDTTARRVTFVSKDGVSKTLKVGEHIDLTTVKAGDSVTIRQSEAMAILVEKP